MKYGFEKEWDAKTKAHATAFEIAKAVLIKGSKVPDMMIKNFKSTYDEIFKMVYEHLMK